MSPDTSHIFNPDVRQHVRSMQAQTTPISYADMLHNDTMPDLDFDVWFEHREATRNGLGMSLVSQTREEMEAELRLAFDAGRQTCIVREYDTQKAAEEM